MGSKRSTELRLKAGIERVEVMVIRRRLRWLGNLERMDVSRLPRCLLVCRPQAGKRSAGGQKRRWNDVVLGDLKKCDLLLDWRDVACERAAWRAMVKETAEVVNHSLEESEAKKKDERKIRREGEGFSVQSQPSTSLACPEPGCNFVGQTNAGLINYAKQRHDTSAQVQMPCPYCGGLFMKQGLRTHSRFCRGNPTQTRRARCHP